MVLLICVISLLKLLKSVPRVSSLSSSNTNMSEEPPCEVMLPLFVAKRNKSRLAAAHPAGAGGCNAKQLFSRNRLRKQRQPLGSSNPTPNFPFLSRCKLLSATPCRPIVGCQSCHRGGIRCAHVVGLRGPSEVRQMRLLYASNRWQAKINLEE